MRETVATELFNKGGRGHMEVDIKGEGFWNSNRLEKEAGEVGRGIQSSEGNRKKLELEGKEKVQKRGEGARTKGGWKNKERYEKIKGIQSYWIKLPA